MSDEASIDDAGCRDQITAERARILDRSGRHSAAIALAVPLLDRVSGRALVSACFAAGTSMVVTGQTAGAIEASERVWPRIWRSRVHRCRSGRICTR